MLDPAFNYNERTASNAADGADSCARQFRADFDERNGYPETPPSDRLPWSAFNADIMSTEFDAGEAAT